MLFNIRVRPGIDPFRPMYCKEFIDIRRKLRMSKQDLSEIMRTSVETIEGYESGMRPVEPILTRMMRELKKEKDFASCTESESKGLP